MTQLWHLLLFQPFVNALVFLYQLLFQNLGLAIIVLTLIIRALLLPVTLPSMRSAAKMKDLVPELEKLKKKFKNKPQEMARAQMELYRQHGASPAAGCLPTIIQMIVLIALYQAFYQVLRPDGDVVTKINQLLYPGLKLASETAINTRFLYLDLAKPDVIRFPGWPFPWPGIFLFAAALTQFLTSKLMAPGVKRAQKKAAKTPQKADDMATAMQSQMIYLFPLMTLIIGFSFPSGLVLYWFVFSLFTLIQQYQFGKREALKMGVKQ